MTPSTPSASAERYAQAGDLYLLTSPRSPRRGCAERAAELLDPIYVDAYGCVYVDGMSVTTKACEAADELLKGHRAARLVDVERQGREAVYSLVDAHVAGIVPAAVQHSKEES